MSVSRHLIAFVVSYLGMFQQLKSPRVNKHQSPGGGSKEEAEADDQDSVPLVDLKPYPCFKGSVRGPVSHVLERKVKRI